MACQLSPHTQCPNSFTLTNTDTFTDINIHSPCTHIHVHVHVYVHRGFLHYNVYMYVYMYMWIPSLPCSKQCTSLVTFLLHNFSSSVHCGHLFAMSTHTNNTTVYTCKMHAVTHQYMYNVCTFVHVHIYKHICMLYCTCHKQALHNRRLLAYTCTCIHVHACMYTCTCTL